MPFRALRRTTRATGVKTFKFRDDQIKTVQAAIDRAKKIAGAEDNSAALAVICEAYADRRTTLTPNSLMETVMRRPILTPASAP